MRGASLGLVDPLAEAVNELDGLIGTWGRGSELRLKRDAIPLRRARLNVVGRLLMPVVMGPHQVEDAGAEFNSRVQIVSPPPDHQTELKFPLSSLNLDRIGGPHGFTPRAFDLDDAREARRM